MLEEAGFGTAGAYTFDPFAFWAERNIDPKCQTKFLGRDESFVVNGIELSLHGDLGPNGSRGSAVNLNKIGIRSIIGHTHAPCIEKGVVQVGTSSYLRLEYTSGPSSWLQTHGLVYQNGKRALVNVIEGEWRG
jgi:hypothetical protein